MRKTVVIVGGGIAGVTVAETLRLKGGDFRILILEKESEPLYSRVLLPHYIKGAIPREKLFLKSWSWYESMGIEYLHGPSGTVEKILAQEKKVLLLDGGTIDFDILILATGTSPRIPESLPPRAHTLFTLADAESLKEDLERIPRGEEALVLGGGFIASELLTIFAKRNIPTKLILRGSGFWSSMLLPEAQEYVLEKVQNSGVDIEHNQGNGMLFSHERGVRFLGEFGDEFFGYCAGVAIGASPELALAHSAGITCTEGVVTQQGKTSCEDIFAVGDVAESSEGYAWAPARLHGNWAHAQQEARALGAYLATGEWLNVPISQYSTSMAGGHFAFLGDTRKVVADELRGYFQGGGYVQEFIKEGMLVGCALLWDVRERATHMARLGKLV